MIKYHDNDNIVCIAGYPCSSSSVIKAAPNGKIYVTNGIDQKTLLEIDYRRLVEKSPRDKRSVTIYQDHFGFFEKSIGIEKALIKTDEQLNYKNKIS